MEKYLLLSNEGAGRLGSPPQKKVFPQNEGNKCHSVSKFLVVF